MTAVKLGAVLIRRQDDGVMLKVAGHTVILTNDQAMDVAQALRDTAAPVLAQMPIELADQSVTPHPTPLAEVLSRPSSQPPWPKALIPAKPPAKRAKAKKAR